MMTEVHVVEHELEYSHSHILGIFSDRELAEQFCTRYMDEEDASSISAYGGRNATKWKRDRGIFVKNDESLNINSYVVNEQTEGTQIEA